MAKTKVDDIDRNIYDIKNKDDYDYKIKKGLMRDTLAIEMLVSKYCQRRVS